jgi:hypothetical protein
MCYQSPWVQFLAITPSISVSANVSYTLHHPALGMLPKETGVESTHETRQHRESQLGRVRLEAESCQWTPSRMCQRLRRPVKIPDRGRDVY